MLLEVASICPAAVQRREARKVVILLSTGPERVPILPSPCPCEQQTLKRQPDCKIRTCRWNLNYLCRAQRFVANRETAGNEIARVLLQTDSDVMILNEYGTGLYRWMREDSGMRALRELLEGAGHSLHVRDCSFPAAVATRLPVVQQLKEVELV